VNTSGVDSAPSSMVTVVSSVLVFATATAN